MGSTSSLSSSDGPGMQKCSAGGHFVGAEMWGMTLQQVTLCRRKARLKYEADGETLATKTMRDIVSDYVVPETRGSGMGLALLMNRDAPVRAEIMISHSWDENFEEFYEALLPEAHVIGKRGLWICAFAIFQCQEGDTSGPSVDAQVGSNVLDGPFARVVRQASLMLVVQTRTAKVYDRLWCVLEAYVAMQQPHLQVQLLGDWMISSTGAFNPQNARCFSKSDEVKIRNAIEALPGGWLLIKQTIARGIEHLIRAQFAITAGNHDMEVKWMDATVSSRTGNSELQHVLSFGGFDLIREKPPIPCIYGEVFSARRLRSGAGDQRMLDETWPAMVLKHIRGEYARSRTPSPQKKAVVSAKGGAFPSKLAEDPELEITVLLALQNRPHPNIIGCYAIGRDSLTGDCHLLLEKVGTFPQCELYAFVQLVKPRLIKECTAAEVLRGTALGVAHLHALHFAHGDLSLDNVLVQVMGDHDRALRPIIIDFGLTRRMLPTEDGVLVPLNPIGRAAGKHLYMSPEQWANNTQYDGRSADVWSLGIILMSMLTGLSPLSRPEVGDPGFDFLIKNLDAQTGQVCAKAMHSFVRPYRDLSAGSLDLLTKILIADEPQRRLQAAAISIHPWCCAERETPAWCRPKVGGAAPASLTTASKAVNVLQALPQALPPSASGHTQVAAFAHTPALRVALENLGRPVVTGVQLSLQPKPTKPTERLNILFDFNMQHDTVVSVAKELTDAGLAPGYMSADDLKTLVEVAIIKRIRSLPSETMSSIALQFGTTQAMESDVAASASPGAAQATTNNLAPAQVEMVSHMAVRPLVQLGTANLGAALVAAFPESQIPSMSGLRRCATGETDLSSDSDSPRAVKPHRFGIYDF